MKKLKGRAVEQRRFRCEASHEALREPKSKNPIRPKDFSLSCSLFLHSDGGGVAAEVATNLAGLVGAAMDDVSMTHKYVISHGLTCWSG